MTANREHTFYINNPKDNFVIERSAQVSKNLLRTYHAFDEMPGCNKMLFFDLEYHDGSEENLMAQKLNLQ